MLLSTLQTEVQGWDACMTSKIYSCAGPATKALPQDPCEAVQGLLTLWLPLLDGSQVP